VPDAPALAAACRRSLCDAVCLVGPALPFTQHIFRQCRMVAGHGASQHVIDGLAEGRQSRASHTLTAGTLREADTPAGRR
jgi:hypothetical protein